ncbi:hypothetical protein GCM10007049_21590 [Echinicola pacifica]|uniref:NlpC/P60 domain-containing protein n=1 Tax=Echinicola pacifica TaxID=346377 RepID=A0A918UR05_9BACT|nr:NlpC/P60 family protein [Echinicola pacifica]GGZ28321.1 hypothetical protein GCM10007049_21590 [Echinicola pacifica]
MQKETLIECPEEQKYGVCRLSLVPVYLSPDAGAGLLTQLLFGETYQVEGFTASKKWMKISIPPYGLRGWMLKAQQQIISKEAFEDYNNGEYKVVTSPMSTIEYKGNKIFLSPGSLLHIGTNELFEVEKHLKFHGESRPMRPVSSPEEIISLARLFLNVPFLSGGRGFFGIGAGSFLQLVFRMAGYQIPKFISEIIHVGKAVTLAEIEAGDVLIFGNNKDIPHHAGIYAGENQVIHVHGMVRIDSLTRDEAGLYGNKPPILNVLYVRRIR